MSIVKTVGRAAYVTFIDAPSKFTTTTQISPNCGGVDGISIFALGILAAVKKYYLESGIDSPHLNSTLKGFIEAKGFVSNVLSVPKSWKDLCKTMENKELDTMKGAGQVAGAAAKTIGLLLKLDSFGLKTISWCIKLDAHYFGGIAAKVGTSKLFVFVGAATLKGFKDKCAIASSTIKIILVCQECYASIYGDADKSIKADPDHTKRYLFVCLCRCTGEVSKILFVFTAGSFAGGVIAFGVFSSVLIVAGPLFDAYVVKRNRNPIVYPAWLA